MEKHTIISEPQDVHLYMNPIKTCAMHGTTLKKEART